jgi:hypothetical protein
MNRAYRSEYYAHIRYASLMYSADEMKRWFLMSQFANTGAWPEYSPIRYERAELNRFRIHFPHTKYRYSAEKTDCIFA